MAMANVSRKTPATTNAAGTNIKPVPTVTNDAPMISIANMIAADLDTIKPRHLRRISLQHGTVCRHHTRDQRVDA